MTAFTVLLLISSALAALALSFYQYLFKAKKKSRLFFFLALLRFVTLFSIFVLLINPIITRKTFETVKTPLPILIDNSLSIKELGQDGIVKALTDKFSGSTALKNKYDLQLYTFAEGFETGKTPNF